METNHIIHGDCVEVMTRFPDNSIHCIVTDPPYGLSFMSKEWDKALPPIKAFEEMNRVLKPGGLAFVMSSPRQDLMWRMMRLLEDSGFELSQSFMSWIYKTGFPKAFDLEKNGAGEEWVGWKAQTGLKPAQEPILMVNKPFSESTIVENVLKWGTGAINVDACRIPVNSDVDDMHREVKRKERDSPTWQYGSGFRNETNYLTGVPEKGRFPANLVVSDDALDDGSTTKSGKIEPHHNVTADEKGNMPHNVYGDYKRQPAEVVSDRTYGDMGSKSRYFDIDEWAKHHGLLDVPKPSVSERDYGVKGKKQTPKSKFNLNDGQKEERFDGAQLTPRRNVHPTVKPVQLMAYLVALGCPKNGIVLDPFVGSGTTCIAAKKLGRKYIGIELEEQYVEIANQRLNAIPFPITHFFS